MNKEIASIVKDKIKDLPFIDKIAGMVKTIETTEKTEVPKPNVIRFPASVDVQQLPPLKQWEYADLVPNSAKKSIFYFENRGNKIGTVNGRGVEMESTIRLIGWMNSKFPVGSDALAISSILKRLAGLQPFNSGLFTRIRITPTAILDQEDKLFSKYTYDEKILQFLMLPFHAFGIDLTVNYILAANCLPELDESEPIV